MRITNHYTTNMSNLVLLLVVHALSCFLAYDELILQQNFKAIGVKIDIQNYPASTLIPTVLDGKYELVEFEASWAYDADDSLLFAYSQLPPTAPTLASTATTGLTRCSCKSSTWRIRGNGSRSSTRFTIST